MTQREFRIKPGLDKIKWPSASSKPQVRTFLKEDLKTFGKVLEAYAKLYYKYTHSPIRWKERDDLFQIARRVRRLLSDMEFNEGMMVI